MDEYKRASHEGGQLTPMADGGARTSYGEGAAIREPSIGKGRFDLISPFAIKRLADWYEAGAAKYAPRNWEKGMPYSRCLDSALRHINKFQRGWTDEDHLAAAVWNLCSIIHFEETHMEEFNDLPDYNKKENKNG